MKAREATSDNDFYKILALLFDNCKKKVKTAMGQEASKSDNPIPVSHIPARKTCVIYLV